MLTSVAHDYSIRKCLSRSKVNELFVSTLGSGAELPGIFIRRGLRHYVDAQIFHAGQYITQF